MSNPPYYFTNLSIKGRVVSTVVTNVKDPGISTPEGTSQGTSATSESDSELGYCSCCHTSPVETIGQIDLYRLSRHYGKLTQTDQ